MRNTLISFEEAKKDTLIKLGGVSKQYKKNSETITVLDSLDLNVHAGDYLAIMGPSGSGKSTLLNLLGAIDRPSQGCIRFGGVDLGALGSAELAAWRARNIGFVFQMYHLLPMLNTEQNVELPLLLTKLNKRERMKRVHAALSLVGLSDRAKHKPSELSGGQEQRVGIARAIVSDASLLLCDEPTGDLDKKSGDEILELLDVLNREFDKTIVMVTHDPSAAARAHRALYMKDGALSEVPSV